MSVVGPVAQWLERAAHNRLVAGSNPAGPTNKSKPRLIAWKTVSLGIRCGTTSCDASG